MNGKNQHSSIHFLRNLAFAAVLYAIVAQPTTDIFIFFTEADHELVDFNWKKDSEEEDTKDEDEKIKTQIAHCYNHHFFFEKKLRYFTTPEGLSYFDLEILIPPPEKA